MFDRHPPKYEMIGNCKSKYGDKSSKKLNLLIKIKLNTLFS